MSRQERLNTFKDPNDRAIVEYLENQGRKAGHNTLEGVDGAGRQGDSFVDGVKTEFKTLTPKADGTPHTVSTVEKVIKRSRTDGGQAEHIIIDARNVDISETDIHRAISKYFGGSSGNLKSVEVIRMENGVEYSFTRLNQ